MGGAWIQEYPVTLMQFFLFLYHNQPDFVHLSSTPEFISSLAATLFSYNIVDHDVTTPTEEFKVSSKQFTTFGQFGLLLISTKCISKNVHIKLIHVHVLDFKFYILNYFVYRNMHIEVFQ